MSVPIEKLRELVERWALWQTGDDLPITGAATHARGICRCELRSLIDAAEAAPSNQATLYGGSRGGSMAAPKIGEWVPLGGYQIMNTGKIVRTIPLPPPPTDEEIERCSESIWQTIEPGSHLKEQHWTTRELQKDRARACLTQFFAGRGWK